MAKQFPLRFPELEGSSRYAHPLLVDCFANLMEALRVLLRCRGLPFRERLRALATVAEVLRGCAHQTRWPSCAALCTRSLLQSLPLPDVARYALPRLPLRAKALVLATAVEVLRGCAMVGCTVAEVLHGCATCILSM